MLEIVINIIIFAIMPICGFFVVKNILNSDEKIFTFKNFFSMLILIVLGYLIYNVEYQSIITLLSFLSIMICYKIIFNMKIFDTFILTILLMILMFISEIILSIIVLPFFPASLLRDFGIPMLLGNLGIGLITVLLSRLNIIKKLVLTLLFKLENQGKIQTAILSLFWIFITSIACYLIANISSKNLDFWLGIFIQIVFLIFMISHFRDKNRYVSLNDKFDTLYNYIETMEEYIDSERLNIHEYRNQLSVIRSITKDKKVIKYIDSLVVNESSYNDWNDEFQNLPTGGFKGLLYYKLAVANSNKLNVTVNISKTCKEFFEKASLNDTKIISRLLGIYLDNAIEAAKTTSKKAISIEIYYNENLNIVVSNSFEEKVDYRIFSNKGYSTKGHGRGNGLYLANKIIKKDSRLESFNTVINDYYVQKLIIK